MKNILRLVLFFFALLLYQNLSASEPLQLAQFRKDGSLIQGYLSQPSDSKDYPIVFLCQGSYSAKSTTQSVYPLHQIISPFFNSVGIAVLSIEKRGVDKECFDAQVFHEYNVISNRLEDYKTILAALRRGIIKKWNGDLILFGTSEGGLIVPDLAVLAHETKAVLVLGGTGAWKFKDAISLFIKKSSFPMSDEEIELQHQTMKANPSPDKFWLNQTYKYWSQALEISNRDVLLDLICPVYLCIGAEDEMIESSDALWQCVKEKNKTNFTYKRYEGIGHKLFNSKQPILEDAVIWIESLSSKIAVSGGVCSSDPIQHQ